MSIRNLSHIKKFFVRAEDPAETQELYKEMLMMTLSRATRADMVTDGSEVATVQQLLLDMLGEEVSAEEVRVAASSKLYETAPIDKYLQSVGPQLETAQRQSIVQALIDVFGVDGKVSATEVVFFDMVVDALKLTPAQIVGLKVGETT